MGDVALCRLSTERLALLRENSVESVADSVRSLMTTSSTAADYVLVLGSKREARRPRR